MKLFGMFLTWILEGKYFFFVWYPNINSTFSYKPRVADAVIEKINPIRLKIEDYLKNPDYLVDVLKTGADKSSQIAEETLIDVKKKVGLGLHDLSKFQYAEKNVKVKTKLVN